MTEKNQEEYGKQLFESLSEVRPEREVPQLEENNQTQSVKRHETLTEEMTSSPLLTDMQAAQARLFPKTLGDNVTNHLMIADISPDAFLALIDLLTIDDIQMSDPLKPINVPKVWTKNYILCSVGLMRKGRIDDLELAGAAEDTAALEKAAKLGLG